jgi:hypothetical protein
MKHPSYLARPVALLAVGLTVAGISRAYSSEAIPVGSARQLLFDDKFIDESEGVEIALNPPVKLGPVLEADRRWEDFRLTSYFTVIQDGDLSRMYYSCFSEDQWNFADAETTWRDYAFLCYAESHDGVHWRKPDLGLVEYEGSTANNILARSIVDGTVFIDPNDDASRRYKMLHTVGPHAGGLRLSSSADGVHFNYGKDPVIDWSPDSQQNMFFDARLGKYVAYLRAREQMGVINEDGSNWRKVARMELADAADWSKPAPKVVFQPDSNDPADIDFYTNACVAYPWAADAYFMFPAVYHHFPKQYGNDGLVDIAAAASRDGLAWRRPDRRPYVPLGEQGEWDSMFAMMGVGMVRNGDKIRQYYSGVDFGHGGTRKESKYSAAAANRRRWGSIGAVEQRLDGFYSADAAYEGGWLTTPPMSFRGSELEININTSSAGSAQVEIRDTDGNPLPGFALADCDLVMTNDAHHRVTWRGKPDVSALAGRAVRLHFKMRSAKLYAFQFVAKDENAR